MTSSNDEAGPSEKRVKLDTIDPAMDVRSINKLFPKIDNFEHFPLKVLLNIFERLDYMDLFNLAENSSRFEGIAKIVLNDRDSHEYFVVDETKHSRDTYRDFFNRFGNEMTAIEAKNKEKFGRNIPSFIWIEPLLNEAKNLEKLTLEGFPLEFLFRNVNKNITNLILRHCYAQSQPESLSEFRNLKKLEIQNGPVLSFDSLTSIIRNNPSMESLVLSENIYDRRGSVSSNYPINRLMEVVGGNLNQLKEFGYVLNVRIYLSRRIQTDLHIINRFVNSLKQLESLALSSNVDIFMGFNELLRRLCLVCKSIKRLKLYDIDSEDGELFDIIRSFENIESLSLRFAVIGAETNFLVGLAPHLRELDIPMYSNNINWSFVWVLLRKCTSLEKFIATGDSENGKMETFGSSQFYNQFTKVIQKQNVQIQIKIDDQVIASITKDEVIWRNKRLRWLGCDQNSSNINLLDLATKLQDAKGADRPSPLDLILGYLDINSLRTFSQTNEKCLQLVENHVKQHSQQQRTFIITNEFFSDSINYDGLELFNEYVINLRAEVLHQEIDCFFYLLENFSNLKKLYICTEVKVSPHELIFPHVRHLIYDGLYFKKYSQLHQLSLKCPDLESFELKRVVQGRFDEKEKERLEFRNLKQFTLKYNKHIEQQAENLRNIFKNTNTKLNFYPNI